jgi:sarcosine oxidase
MKVAVIGLGAGGTATARHLARSGHNVVGFEQFSLGHDRGSSHGASRVARFAYTDPLYSSLMDAAAPLWRDIEAETQRELWCRNGHVMVVPRGHEHLGVMTQALSSQHRNFEVMDRHAVMQRFPAFTITDDELAVFQPDGGFIRPSMSVAAFAESARAAGAQLHEHCAIVSITARADSIGISTADGEYHSVDRVVISAGPWMSRLAPPLAQPLVVSRQQFVYLAVTGDPSRYEPSVFPTWGHSVTNWYGFPTDGMYPGLKIAHHEDGITTDPDQVDRDLAPSTLAASLVEFSARIVGAGVQVLSSATCMYTNTWNEDFVIDHLPGEERIVMMSACSGHGFKFMPYLGAITANLVTGTRNEFDISRFRARWADAS